MYSDFSRAHLPGAKKYGLELAEFKIDVFTITAARETNCSLLTRKDCVSEEVTGKRG